MSDGQQITMLLLYLFSKYARFLIEHGYIYISVSPLYEQGGKFYAPFEFLCNTMLSALNNSYTYNGKDFYQDTDKFTSTEYTSLCYSGEAGFLYYSKYSNDI